MFNKTRILPTPETKRAKELYYAFGTSGFQMMREGVLDEYKSYNISKKQEDLWRVELLDMKLLELDINNFNSSSLLRYVIQNHLDVKYFEKYIRRLNNVVEYGENQYFILCFGQSLFSMLFAFVREKSNISKKLKLLCLETCDNILLKVRRTSLPDNFLIADFKIIGDGLTQEQYILRKIVELEYNLEKAKILK